MITTEIYNGQGLGNQLWCYVVTRVIALRNGYDWGIMHPERLKCLDFLTLDVGKEVTGITTRYVEKGMFHPTTGADIRLYDPGLMSVPDNTKLDGVMQDEQYIFDYRDQIRQWLAIKPEFDCTDYASDGICVINFRGGEYMRHKELLLDKTYWTKAMNYMREINPAMRFVVITDDVNGARTFFPDLEVHHFSIGKDYAIIHNAHYLILSNSSFAWFPAWLSTNLKRCIAPLYWARHNVSDGYWSMGYSMTSGWQYQDRHGTLVTYDQAVEDFARYRKAHPDYFIARPEPRPSLLKKILRRLFS